MQINDSMGYNGNVIERNRMPFYGAIVAVYFKICLILKTSGARSNALFYITYK